jgi:hypothetical protein
MAVQGAMVKGGVPDYAGTLRMQDVHNRIVSCEQGTAEPLQVGLGTIQGGGGEDLAGFEVHSNDEGTLESETYDLFQ